MRLLLDTCTFLWMTLGSPELSDKARKELADPANDVFLSVVSAWELAVMHGLGRLPLPADPAVWLPKAREDHGVETLELDEIAVLHLPRLPRLHTDPFDRMLVCQAIAAGMAIVTPDREISAYPIRTLW